MLIKIRTATLSGVEGYPVTVETDLRHGMPEFSVVGLADTTIRESCKRIRPAIMNSGYSFPNERITVNLVPADKPKEGSHFDLPIAVSIILLMEGVEIGVMLRQVEDGAWKVSVRTSPAFDAARICARFGGGGHRGAAGGTLHQDLETAEQTVLSSVGEEVAL